MTVRNFHDLSIHLSIDYISIYSIYLWSIYLSIYLSIYILYLYNLLYLSIYLSIYLSSINLMWHKIMGMPLTFLHLCQRGGCFPSSWGVRCDSHSGESDVIVIVQHCLSVLYVYLSIDLSTYILSIDLIDYRSIYISIYLYLSISIYLSTYPIYLSRLYIYLYTYLFISLIPRLSHRLSYLTFRTISWSWNSSTNYFMARALSVRSES